VFPNEKGSPFTVGLVTPDEAMCPTSPYSLEFPVLLTSMLLR
jgi:hypothetical protein